MSVTITILVTIGLIASSPATPVRSLQPSMVSDAACEPLLIIGAGVLGRLAAVEWREARGKAAGTVIGVTRSSNEARNDALRADGIEPRVRADVDAEGTRYPYVLFCASPSGNDDYAQAVASALQLWDSEAGGRFVFTSSAAVYAEDQGGVVTENSPLTNTPRTAPLLAAELKVLQAGGTVVRLAGLYLEDRGAHNYWLNQVEVKQRPDGIINLLHYRDAAGAAVAALLRGSAEQTLLAADDQPLTREAICREACRAPRFQGRVMPRFTGTDGGIGKRVDCRATRDAIGWKPRYATFGKFVDTLARL